MNLNYFCLFTEFNIAHGAKEQKRFNINIAKQNRRKGLK